MSRYSLLILCFSALILESCTSDDTVSILQKDALLPPIIYPLENPISATKVQLGRTLFFDPILSTDSTISCASCHLPEFAFSDTIPVSKGAHSRLGFRNSPSLYNLAWKPLFFKDGGVRNLELQVLAPLFDPNELDFGSTELVKRLKHSPLYFKLFQKAFGGEPSLNYVVKALASFERMLIYNESKFDLFLKQEIMLSKAELRGMQLFYSPKLACGSCHTGILFTDFQYYDIGLPPTKDVGRYRVTLDSLDKYKFETPSLKAVGLTAPYMHNGSMDNLRKVIEWYNIGGEIRNLKDARIRPLDLSKKEKEDLLTFLHCL